MTGKAVLMADGVGLYELTRAASTGDYVLLSMAIMYASIRLAIVAIRAGLIKRKSK